MHGISGYSVFHWWQQISKQSFPYTFDGVFDILECMNKIKLLPRAIHEVTKPAPRDFEEIDAESFALS